MVGVVRTLLVLPAVAIPLALVVLVVAARRLADAVHSLRLELAAAAELGTEFSALKDDLEDLARRRVQHPGAPR